MYPIETPVESDEFDSRKLGLQWEWHANYQDTFGFTTNMGYMRIYGHELSKDFKNFWEVPNLLLQKFSAEEFTATAKLKISAKMDGQLSGMIVMGWDYTWLGIEKQGENFVLKQGICKDAEHGSPEQVLMLAQLPPSRKFDAGIYPNYEREIYIRLRVGKGALCRFSYSLDGKRFVEIGSVFKARQGKWIGAKMGMFSVTPYGEERGWVDIDWFHVEK